jgi:hypothetical protein
MVKIYMIEEIRVSQETSGDRRKDEIEKDGGGGIR